jgi:hypothetical protein
MKQLIKIFLAFALVHSGIAFADPLNITALMVAKEQIRLDFNDGSGHFVLMVKREGQATGAGVFAGASVTEFGRHDITPRITGDASAYLVLTQGAGNIAYIKCTANGIFFTDKDGKLEIRGDGLWEIVSGVGVFKGMKGAGKFHIRPGQTPMERIFILEGETSLPQ